MIGRVAGVCVALVAGMTAWGDVTNINGVAWEYVVLANNIGIVSVEGSGDITVPDRLRVQSPLPVTDIMESAFAGLADVTSVTTSTNMRYIGESAFDSCSGLTNVVFEEGVKRIRSYAFAGCASLANVEIPSSLAVIEEGAFEGCDALPNENGIYYATDEKTEVLRSSPDAVAGDLALPESVRFIANGAFLDCSNITSVVIGKAAERIGEGAFRGCASITNMVLPFTGTRRWTPYVPSNEYPPTPPPSDESDSTYSQMFLNVFGPPVKDASINSGTWDYHVWVFDSEFWQPERLDTVTITDQQYLEGFSFAKCSAKKIVLPESGLQEIYNDVFYYCTNLTGITVPKSVQYMREGVFDGCVSLESIELPFVGRSRGDDNEYYYSWGYFCYGYDYTDYYYNGYDYKQNYSVANESERLMWLFSGWKWEDKILMVKEYYDGPPRPIQNYTNAVHASGCGIQNIPASLKKVVITDETEITTAAFEGCTNLVEIVLPDTVQKLGDGIFWGCDSLKSVRLPNGLRELGSNLFKSCTSLEKIEIPEGVRKLGACVFDGCLNLESIKLPSSLRRIEGPLRTNDVTAVDLKEFTYPAGCENEHGWPAIMLELFPDSYRTIRNVTIAEGSRAITHELFWGCWNLESVVVPASVGGIEVGAFNECYGLERVRFMGNAPSTDDYCDSVPPGSSPWNMQVFSDAPYGLQIEAPEGSIGWDKLTGDGTPETWGGRQIVFTASEGAGASDAGGGASAGGTTGESLAVNLTVTNVVVHYIKTAAVSEAVAPVTQDTGIVAVMTEVKGGNFAVPESWAENYPGFAARFGTDFGKAMTKPTGKRDSAGNPLMVWHDYVCGTDPTDEDDIFKASITIVDGVPQVSYTPELSTEQAALRKYTFWGKERLTDEAWTEIAEEETGKYNFFKVTVEMK